MGVMRRFPRVILVIDLMGEYNHGLLRGIAQYSNLHGPWAFYSAYEKVHEKLTMPQVRNWGANGIIAHFKDTVIAQQVKAMKLPTVLASDELPVASQNLPYIEIDGVELGTTAAEYLLNLGFRDFAYCGFEGIDWSLSRGKSFAERITKAGFPTYVYERNIRSDGGSWESEQRLLIKWLRSLPTPVGLMACDDFYGRRVIEACKLANRNVPRQIAVLGVDNDKLICNITGPKLSSVALSTEKAGYEAAATLDKLMSGEKTSRQKIIVHPTHIVTRPSTDTLATKDQEVIAAVQFIHKNVSKLIQVNDVANAVTLSRRALELRFHKVLGRSVLDEIRTIRTNQVVRMLIETDMSILQIAFAFGYTNSQNMTKSFSRVIGMPPLAYRKKYSPK